MVPARRKADMGRTSVNTAPGTDIGIGGAAELQMATRYQGRPMFGSVPNTSHTALNSKIDTPAPTTTANRGLVSLPPDVMMGPAPRWERA